MSIDTSTRQLDIGARVRYRLGEDRSALHILGDIDYGFFRFFLDPNDVGMLLRQDVIPPIRYSYINLALGASYGIVDQYLTISAQFKYRLGLGVGTDARRIWGTQTSGSNGIGVAVELSSEVLIIDEGSVYVKLGFEWFRFSTLFRGQTACQNPAADGSCTIDEFWEPWPAEPPPPSDDSVVVGGFIEPVVDNYLRLSIAVGFAYR